MNPQELVDKEKLQKVFEVCTGRDCDSVDAFVEEWGKAKEKLFRMFGDKLKVETPINNNVSDDQARELIRNFTLLNTWLVSEELRRLMRNVNIDSFFENKCDMAEYNLPSPVPPNYKRGMKLSAVFRHYVEDPEEKVEISGKTKTRVEWFDIQYSKLRQSLQTKGVLALSIDPLDILTMSLNSSGWRSCHSALNGEYRGGCMSYATDESSIIAYVYNGKEVEIEGLQGVILPSKNWRQMIYASTDERRPGCIFSRQYPRYDYVVEKQVHDFMAKQIKEHFKLEDSPVIISSEDDECNRENIQESLYDVEGHLHYSDIGNGFDGYMLTFSQHPDMLDISVGNDSITCPCCGSGRVEDSDELLCDDCAHSHKCAHCGEMYNDHDLTHHDGEWYCPDCFRELFVRCDDCGRFHKRADTHVVENDRLVCDTCFECYEECYQCGTFHRESRMRKLSPEVLGTLGVVSVCSSCFNDLGFHRCASCCSITKNEENYKGFVLCDSCLDDFKRRDEIEEMKQRRANQVEELEETTA